MFALQPVKDCKKELSGTKARPMFEEKYKTKTTTVGLFLI